MIVLTEDLRKYREIVISCDQHYSRQGSLTRIVVWSSQKYGQLLD